MEMIIEENSTAADRIPEITDETLSDSGFYWREVEGVKALVNRRLEKFGFANAFSSRLGGVSPFPANDLNLAGFDEDTSENIMENRRRFLNVFDGEYTLTTAWQVHGDAIRLVGTRRDASRSDERADALVSDLTQVLIGVKTADCVPILIGDIKTGAYAAVHAGWRGTAQSIARKTVEKLKHVYASKPVDLVCAIGPAASGRAYEVGQDVIDVFKSNFSTSGKYFEPTRPGHALVDLHTANKDQLVEAGVLENQIFIAPFCTILHVDLFFSYRIEKKQLGKVGRLLSVIGRM
jgi:YfiH family protein